MPLALSDREKKLLAALAAALALLAVLWAWRSLAQYQRDLAVRLDADRELLTQVRLLDAQADPGSGTRPVGRSLAATLEDLLSRTGLRERIQLNPITQSGSSRVQAMEVKAEQLTLDEMVRLVYLLEGPDLPVQIDQMEVGTSFRDKELLRVTLRVLGQG